MIHPLSPTAVLPALASLHVCNAVCVGDALQALRCVYFPHAPPAMAIADAVRLPGLKQSLSQAVPALRPKRTVCHVYHDDVPDSGYASAEEDNQDDEEDRHDEGMKEEEELDRLRSDAFEHGYAVKWLTGLVKRADAWICGTGSCPSAFSSEEQAARTACLEDALRLLARFAGDDEPEPALIRTFVFPFRTPSSSCSRCHCRALEDADMSPITVELNDAPVEESDHTAVGLQSWGSAIVLAEYMCKDPERYLGTLHSCACTATVPMLQAGTETTTMATHRCRRLLELGAGTGLLSITAAQILSRTCDQAKIDATDYHPDVLENLTRNVQHNRSAVDVSVKKLDWCAMACADGGMGIDQGEDGDEDVGVGVYDVVLAADVVYYPEHAHWIRASAERTLKKDGVFWLIIPVRTIGRHEGLGKTVEEAFPTIDRVGERMCRAAGSKEHLAILHREDVERVDGVGRADEGGYTLFEIRWV